MTSEPNPYAPPTAAVAEVISTKPAQAPREVKRAVRLLWVSLVISLLSFFLGIVSQSIQGPIEAELAGVVFVIVFMLIGVGIVAWIFHKIARGRNWARILWLLLVASNVVYSAFNWRQTIDIAKVAPLLAAINLIGTVIEFYAVFLLFSRPAAPWFAPELTQPAPVR